MTLSAIAWGIATLAAAQTEYKLIKSVDLPGDKAGHG